MLAEVQSAATHDPEAVLPVPFALRRTKTKPPAAIAQQRADLFL
jgi:hypothetical protein